MFNKKLEVKKKLEWEKCSYTLPIRFLIDWYTKLHQTPIKYRLLPNNTTRKTCHFQEKK